MSDETLPVDLDAELDALFGGYVATDYSPGLVYGRFTRHGLAHGRGFGTCDAAGATPDVDTVFPIASITKSFTAASCLVARDRGLLDLDAPVTDLVPELLDALDPGDGDRGPSTRQLLSMTGGLTEDNAWIDPAIDTPVDGILELVRRGVRFSRPPGTGYEYSNLGYVLAGVALSRAVEQPLADWLHGEVLEPLGLTRTYVDNRRPEHLTPATGYTLDSDGAWLAYPPNLSDAGAPAGGLMSCARDLATWAAWLGAAHRPGGDDRVLSRPSRRELQRLHAAQPPAVNGEGDRLRLSTGGYGLGLVLEDHLHHGRLVSHSGGLPGFTLHVCWHPDSGHGVVVLTNSHRGSPAALCRQALDRALTHLQVPARTVTLWPETVDLRRRVDALVRAWDDDAASAVFAPNVDFDRPLPARRQAIAALVDEVGPLRDPLPADHVVQATTPAEVCWSLPAERGELLCYIHLTPFTPAQVQEIVVVAVPAGTPRSAVLHDLSPRRSSARLPTLHADNHVRVQVP